MSCTYAKNSKASSLSSRMSHRSRPSSTRLVGSMLYRASTTLGEAQGYEAVLHGDSDSRTGPTINEGQIMESDFSKWMVSRRLFLVCSDSIEEEEDVRLDGPWVLCGEAGWEVVNRPLRRESVCKGKPLKSSAASETGDDRAGEDSDSSKSEANPASRDAAKLLEISVSETTANDD